MFTPDFVVYILRLQALPDLRHKVRSLSMTLLRPPVDVSSDGMRVVPTRELYRPAAVRSYFVLQTGGVMTRTFLALYPFGYLLHGQLVAMAGHHAYPSRQFECFRLTPHPNSKALSMLAPLSRFPSILSKTQFTG